MEKKAADFGAYLRSVEERDVDLLLLEEFHIDPSFVQWFGQQVGLTTGPIFDGAWHSISDQDGETDLLLRVWSGADRVAVLIEDKINASEQPDQDQRYHLRGVRARESGLCERFVTVICAPETYLKALSAGSVYQHRVSYEAVLGWYKSIAGPRSEWRQAVLSCAIDQGRRGYAMKVHVGKTAFQKHYWQHLRSNHPGLVMAQPGPKGPKSDWMLFKGVGFPKGVKLVHKNDQACMDLEFERTLATALEQRRSNWPEGALIVQRGASAALSLPVPRCDMDRPFAEQIENVRAALAAANRLAAFADSMSISA